MAGRSCSSNLSGTQVLWQMRSHAALRTALACAIVGAVAIYSPSLITDRVKFIAFSYLTAVIIIMPDATLGNAIAGLWHTFCATAQVAPLAMLGRWAVEGRVMGIARAAVAVAVGAFLVALPEWTHLTAKRIAFGQMVVVFTDAVQSQEHGLAYMRPVYVAASVALGALASAMALLLPYPDLTSNKIRKLCHAYGDNASQRMNLYLRALGATENHAKKELLSQAKPLAETGAKLLHTMRMLQESMPWEKPAGRQYSETNMVDGLQSMELQLRGIQHSLDSTTELTIEVVNQDMLSNVIKSVSVQVEQKIKQIRCFSPFKSPNEAETRRVKNLSLPAEQFHPIVTHGWVFFCFSCIDTLLDEDADICTASTGCQTRHRKAHSDNFKAIKTRVLKIASKERLEFALRCSLSLGLAVLFGLIFDKRNGRWAGLTVAISFDTGKQAVFTLANSRAQGTAIGSIYGVICCFLLHYEVLKLLALLPWVVLSSFLRYSKMYGQSGGISSAIGALLILGRKNYGAPNEFALARVTEVFIGLSAFILVVLCLQPIRGAELAKSHLSTTLSSLLDCTKKTTACLTYGNQTIPKYHELRYEQRNLNCRVHELKKVVADAELEPNFWYFPFQSSCYQKLVGSLSKIADMLHFIIYNFEKLAEQSEGSNIMKEIHHQINEELELCNERISSSLEYLQKVDSIRSCQDSRGQSNQLRDLEMGKLQNTEKQSNLVAEVSMVANTNEGVTAGKKELDIQYLSATAFCFSAFVKEIDEIVINIREIQ